MQLRTGPWNLTDLSSVEKNGLKVFSCFHCGGGSTMGYKLAGYEVLGGVEIDPEMMKIYKTNHDPKYSFLMGVQDFNKLPFHTIPQELFELDILDGSPPCSSFSMAGSREKAWGEKKKFREGQADQVLDDLFFHFIETARILQPKVVVAENVKGLLMGNARGYVKQIFQMFSAAGYDTQLFLLNSAFMGVPQRRERTFFIARRKDMRLPKIHLNFNEKTISIKDACKGVNCAGKKISQNTKQLELWLKTKNGDSFSKVSVSGWFNYFKLNENIPAQTITAQHQCYYHWSEPCYLSDVAFKRIQSFPDDYNFLNQEAGYVCGMSVPPFMAQRVACQIAKQFFKIN